MRYQNEVRRRRRRRRRRRKIQILNVGS